MSVKITLGHTFEYDLEYLMVHPASKQFKTWDAASTRQKVQHAAFYDFFRQYEHKRDNSAFFDVKIEDDPNEVIGYLKPSSYGLMVSCKSCDDKTFKHETNPVPTRLYVVNVGPL